jgi:hypothetical protein
MAVYTKAEAQTKINLLIDNSGGSITPTLLRQALNYLLDMKQHSTHIEYDGELLSDVLDLAADSNIPQWSAKAWPSGYFVYHTDGLIYKSNTSIVAEDTAPDVSAKWDSLDNLKPTPSFSTNLSANQIDWSLDSEIFWKTITSNTTLTFANTENTLNKIITLVFTGNYTLTFPATCRLTTTAYNATTYPNYIRIHCVYVHPTDHTQDIFYVTITKQSAI